MVFTIKPLNLIKIYGINTNHFTLLALRGWGNWASEASPTVGCSIEISRDIYICMSVCLQLSMGNPHKNSYAIMRGWNYVFQTRACSK